MLKKDQVNDSSAHSISETKEQVNLIRPKNINEYFGQQKLKEQFKIYIESAQIRKEPLDHILFYGPPGLGKTTLAMILAHEMQVKIKQTSGPALEKPADLAAILTSLEENDMLFIDEIHRLGTIVEEILYPAMEDYKIDLMIGQGAMAQNIVINIPKFTLVGATTKSGLLTNPLRDRFGIVEKLEFYTNEELIKIIVRSSKILQIAINNKGALEIAKRARSTPRIANNLLKRVRDFAVVLHKHEINQKIANQALTSLGIDDAGLDKNDQQYLTTIIKNFDGGPVGVDSLATSLHEEKITLEEMIEPYLIKEGFVKRTSKGREATVKAYKHLNIALPFQDSIF